MSEYFIVLATEPQRHQALEEARAEKIALAAHFPDKTFTIHRCKTYLHGAKHFTKMVELIGDLVRDGWTDANQERARLLMLTIGNRTPRLRTLRQVEGPEEYQPPLGAKMPPATREANNG